MSIDLTVQEKNSNSELGFFRKIGIGALAVISGFGAYQPEICAQDAQPPAQGEPESVGGRIKRLEAELRVNPSLEKYILLSDLYFGINENEKAFQAAKRALELDETDPAALNNIAVYHMRKDDYSEAKRCLDKAVESMYVHSASHLNLGTLYAKRGNFVEAVKQYNISSILNPNDKDAVTARERTLEHVGKVFGMEKRKELEQRAELTSDDWVNISTGYYDVWKLGRDPSDLEKGGGAARQAVGLDRGNWRAHMCLSSYYFIKEEYPAAELEASLALELEQKPEIYLNLGASIYMQGDHMRALEVVERGVRRFPEDEALPELMEIIQRKVDDG